MGIKELISPLDYEDSASTPLSPDEREGLIPDHIATRGELNEFEQANILEAEQWALRRKRNVLDSVFLRELHRRMLGNVWDWAGSLRNSEKTIGIDPAQIAPSLHQLIGDCCFWLEKSTYDVDESAARFHHRLVAIHPFPNGNGRHARLATDLLLIANNRPRFTWGSQSLSNTAEARTAYVAALRAADGHNLAPLLEFVRS